MCGYGCAFRVCMHICVLVGVRRCVHVSECARVSVAVSLACVGVGVHVCGCAAGGVHVS